MDIKITDTNDDAPKTSVYENAVDGSFTETETTYTFNVTTVNGIEPRTFEKVNGVTAEVLG